MLFLMDGRVKKGEKKRKVLIPELLPRRKVDDDAGNNCAKFWVGSM